MDPTCEGFDLYAELSCYFKKGMYIGKMGPADDTQDMCWAIESRIPRSSRICCYGAEHCAGEEMNGFSWSHNGPFRDIYSTYGNVHVKALPSEKVMPGTPNMYTCRDKCEDDEECGGFTWFYDTRECTTIGLVDLENENVINNRARATSMTKNSLGSMQSWTKACLNKDPHGPEPPAHVEIMKASKCENFTPLTGADLYHPSLYAPDVLKSETDCKRAVMNQLGKKCAYPAQFGWEKTWKFRSTEISGCYCVPKGKQCYPTSWYDRWHRFYMDAPKAIGDNSANWIEENEDKGALSTTPIPSKPQIKLVAVDEVCMNVKSLRKRHEMVDPYIGQNGESAILGKVLWLDECMQRALADPDCHAHGPTIQFHDYTSIQRKPKVVSLGLNAAFNSRGMGTPDNFFDYDCSCSVDCEMDVMDIRTGYPDHWHLPVEGIRSKRGTCTGQIRGINTMADRAKLISEGYLEEGNLYGESNQRFTALSSNPYKIRAMPEQVAPQEVVHPGEMTINEWGDGNTYGWYYPPTARYWDVDNFEFERGSCMDPNFRYKLTEDDIKQNNIDKRGHTNVYTMTASEEDFCIDDGETDADGNRKWTLPEGRLKCITPSPDDWCSGEGEVHQYTETCGRVCHDLDGNRGVLKDGTWGPDVTCDACPDAAGLFGWIGCKAPLLAGEDCYYECDEKIGFCPRCRGEDGTGGFCCRHGYASILGCDGFMGTEGVASPVCGPSPAGGELIEDSLCLVNNAYHSGAMCDTVYDASASDCQKACEADACCNYWDHEIGNKICRLRSSEGDGGPIPTPNYAAGAQDCTGLCLTNYGYPSGPMCDTVYGVDSKGCREACERDACCNYWDHEVQNSICRLRSEAGGDGAVVLPGFDAGIQDCLGL